jgi:hypothetical protein
MENTDVASIPNPLSIPDLPELSVFPESISFYFQENPQYYAVYLPQIRTYSRRDNVKRMIYVSEGDSRARVVVEYDSEKTIWKGDKFFGSESIGSAFGINWRAFFVHLTVLGCDRREMMAKIAVPLSNQIIN